MPSFTVDTMLARIKRKCQLPANNGKLSDAEIVQIADEEIQTRLFAALMTVRDDYFVGHRTMTYPANARFAQLPEFVESSTILDVSCVDDSQSPPRYRLLDRRYSGAAWHGPQSANTPNAYAIEGDRVSMIAMPDQAITLMIRYERRPSRLHLTTDGRSAPIVSYDESTFEFTVTPSATWITNAPVGTMVDIVRATPAFDALVQGMEVDTVASPIWTLVSGIVDHSSPDTAPISQQNVNVGDYVTLMGETPIFPLPDAWWSPAIYAAAAAVCREIGDAQNGAINEAQASQLIGQVIALQSNRVRKQNPIVFNHSSPRRIGPWGIRRPGENEWWFG